MYQLAAQRGLATAKADLDRCYEEGTGVVRNMEMAEWWYIRAFLKIFWIGFGGIIATDWEGKRCIRTSQWNGSEWPPTNGTALAQSTMEFIYQTGSGIIEEDPKMAFEYLLGSAQRGLKCPRTRWVTAIGGASGLRKRRKQIFRLPRAISPYAMKSDMYSIRGSQGSSQGYVRGTMQCHNESRWHCTVIDRHPITKTTNGEF
ncbi:hypothetical protein BJ742DRAFT_865649 [Cladochytrium replicatum]|nr:hypothetical protein BJ742DRAFT_865649 [Cladochytrium replicatum]